MKAVLSVVTLALVASSMAVQAGPTKMKKTGEQTDASGKSYMGYEVVCSGKSEPATMKFFKESKEYCLADGSFCSKKKMRVAKKACK